MIPSEGAMPAHIKNAKFKVPLKNRSYDVMIANCNDVGRHVRFSGQVIFDFDDDPTTLSSLSIAILTSVAFCICLLFSLLSIKIYRGTRADWEYQQLRRFERMREEEERRRLQEQEQEEPPQNSNGQVDPPTSQFQQVVIV
jgi:hypothetical protein